MTNAAGPTGRASGCEAGACVDAQASLGRSRRLDGLVARDVRREARRQRVHEWLARRRPSRASRAATRTTRAPRTPSSPETSSLVPTPTVAVRAPSSRSANGVAGPREHVRHSAGRADRTRGVVLVGAVEAERGERRVARQHLGNASVLLKSARQIVEDAPLDRPQALGIERAVAAGDLGELDVDDAHEPAVGGALERRLRRGRRARGLGGARRGRVERGVVQQDRALELAQRGARLEAVRVAQQRAQIAVAREGIRLAARSGRARAGAGPAGARAAGSREREHLELGHEVGVPAERELGLDALLGHRQAALLEPGDLGLREARVGELRERRAAPERERGAKGVDGGAPASPASSARAASAASCSKRPASISPGSARSA